MLSASFIKMRFGNMLIRVHMAGALAVVLPTAISCCSLQKCQLFPREHNLKKHSVRYKAIATLI